MTKEELINAISGLPVETQIYKIDDYADLDHSDGCPLLGVIRGGYGFAYRWNLYLNTRRSKGKNFLTFLKNTRK